MLRFSHQSEKWVSGFSIAVLGLAGLASLGWMFSLPLLTQVNLGCPTIRANSILSLVLLSSAILLTLRGKENSTVRAKMLALLVIVLTVFRVYRKIKGEVDFLDFLFPALRGPHSLGVSFCFILASFSLFTVDWKNSVFSQCIAAILCLISFGALVGHLYNVPAFYSFFIPPTHVGLSIPTALGLFLISISLFLLRPDVGLMKVFTSETAAGKMAKRLVIATFALSSGVAIIFRIGEYLGFYGSDVVQVLVNTTILFGLFLILFFISKGVYEDELKQKEMANSLQILKNQLASIVESSHDAIISFSVEGIIQSWNSHAEILFGYKKEEAIGKSGIFLVPKDLCNEFKSYKDRLMKREMIPAFRTICLSKNHSPIDVSLAVSPLLNSSGEVIGISWVARDITKELQQYRTIQELQEKRTKELEQSNLDLDRFAAIASHDLREPIRTMDIYCQLLECEKAEILDEECKRYIGIVKSGARRASQLIEGLLTYSRATHKDIHKREVKAQSVLERALFNLQGKIIETKAHISHDVLPSVIADELLLERIFQNLIGNAIKYHRPNEIPSIHIGCETLKKEHLFFVSDNGVGIPRENFDHIFQIFRRASNHENCEGLGIGLAICKRAVELTKGRIWLESTVGKGTTFYFTIPFAEASSQLRLVNS